MYRYPKYVSVKTEAGVKQVLYKEIMEHERDVIEDTIWQGLVWVDDREREIAEYEKRARKELKDLKARLREGNNVVLRLDRNRGRYVICENEYSSSF